MNVKMLKFPIHGDDRGNLIALEAGKDIPFEIKRVYYIFGTLPEVERGMHAHKNLEQVLVCTSGSCKIELDDGKDIETVLLDKPDIGLYIDHAVWRKMYDFSSDAVLMVLASQLYNEEDYIRDYDKFIKYLEKEILL